MGNAALKKHCANAQKTGVLNFSKHSLESFPTEVLALNTVLRNIDLSENKFCVLPSEIGSFKQLRTLTINHNRLTALPPEIGNLEKLEHLNASNNKIQTLPQSISKLKQLKNVDLSHNELRTFPTMFSGLERLDMLDLSVNKITEVPQEVADFFVTELNLNRNQISKLSSKLSEAPKLKALRLEENCLSLDGFPKAVLVDSKISLLSVEGNTFDMKDFMKLEGYENYMERYTAVKKKMF